MVVDGDVVVVVVVTSDNVHVSVDDVTAEEVAGVDIAVFAAEFVVVAAAVDRLPLCRQSRSKIGDS